MKNHFGTEEIDLKEDVVTKYLSVSIKGFEVLPVHLSSPFLV